MMLRQLDIMPGRLGLAARFVLSSPVDVALHSMRKQAKLAGVSHSTMVRLAEWMGLDGYDSLRAIYREGIKAGMGGSDAASSASAAAPLPESSDGLERLANEVERFGLEDNLQRHAEAASILLSADRIICVASEAGLPVAVHFQQLMESIGRTAVFYDVEDGTSSAALKSFGSRDVMLAIATGSASPRVTHTARYADRKGIRVVALTDCPRSSIASFSNCIIVPSQAPGSPATIAATVAVVETVVSMIV